MPTLSNRGSIRATAIDEPVGIEPTTHTARGDVASPVGVSATEKVLVTAVVFGSIRVTVWSSRLATHNDPDPYAIELGRAPTFGTWPTTWFEPGSISATALPWTVMPPPEPPCPNANTGIATAAASTPTNAEPAYMRRRLRVSSTSRVFSGPNSVTSPSITS